MADSGTLTATTTSEPSAATGAESIDPASTGAGHARHGDTTVEPALVLTGLTKTFRSGLLGRGPRVHALNGLDLTVPAGTVHAVLGPNGAGKTTTVRAVATLMRPDSGSVVVGGIDALADPDGVRDVIGVSGQYAAVDGNLTGFENLRLVAQLYGLSRGEASERARQLIADLDLEAAADRPMRTYSGGMRRRLDLAGALINRPMLVILDEPTTGLDPRGRRQIWEVIRSQVASGTTVLLTTQYLEEADELADEITVIDHGSVLARGTATSLKETAGQSILTVEVDARADAGQVAGTLSHLGVGEPERLDETHWTVPVADGTRSAVTAVKAFDATGIEIVDATVMTPTLDDVFLKLTGHEASPDDDTDGSADGGDAGDHGLAGRSAATGSESETQRLERIDVR
ncbi:ATP-binding cassette domain-containing protein [Gordonia soli]|uniref:Putative ABC transporter ATP-binding protein n=1 Tax=Gordonia soli NBRC 108243 TaxID=1223545 RepID=M0QCI8_9ACTN|nr:ATP-binding cassette domain-containing protein [Gordonia soli]GAC66275.1 putative ABC transporter ATP-binding protein [Gordonia soli NBRC 108243]